MLHVILNEQLHPFLSFYSTFLISNEVVYWQCYLVVTSYMAGATWNCCHLSASLHNTTMHQYTLLFIQRYIGRVHVHLWPRALVAEWPGCFMRYCGNTGGMNTERSQQRSWPLEKKMFLQGFKHRIFQSRVWHSNPWAIPAPPTLDGENPPIPS